MKTLNSYPSTTNHKQARMHFARLAALFVVTVLLVAACHADTTNIFGFDHTSLGNANLAVNNGSLVVSNIGHDNGDGVAVALPSYTTYWHAHFDDINMQPGSYVQMQSFGTINGIAGQQATTIRQTQLDGQNTQINFDWSHVTSDPIAAQYYWQGNLVYSGFDQLGTSYLATKPIKSAGIDFEFKPFKVTASLDWGDTGTFLDTPGFQGMVDEIAFGTTSLKVDFGGYSSVNLTGSDIGSLTINAEDFQGVPEPSSLALLGTGLVGVGGFLRGRLLC